VFSESKELVMRKTLIYALVGAAMFVAVEMGGNALAAVQATTSKTVSEKSSATAATPEQLKREKGNASSRMQQDRRRFPRPDVADAEAMYQAASKNWRSAEAKQGVRTMSAKYPRFNRTGCAIMYLGQMAEGEERVRYLSEAIAKHGDCYFGNGVQVGSFGRYLLGHTYLDQGKDAEARKLFEEIRADYPNALTPGGASLVAVMKAEGRSMQAGTQPSGE
jgi:TolA-binding protein